VTSRAPMQIMATAWPVLLETPVGCRNWLIYERKGEVGWAVFSAAGFDTSAMTENTTRALISVRSSTRRAPAGLRTSCPFAGAERPFAQNLIGRCHQFW
jgi:hypothetical protein